MKHKIMYFVCVLGITIMKILPFTANSCSQVTSNNIDSHYKLLCCLNQFLQIISNLCLYCKHCCCQRFACWSKILWGRAFPFPFSRTFSDTFTLCSYCADCTCFNAWCHRIVYCWNLTSCTLNLLLM